MDFAAIVEEIALEGLDGITLDALWQRLKARPDFVDDNLDDDYKVFIWNFLTNIQDVKFYILPDPRPDLVIFSYNDHVTLEKSMCMMPKEIPPDIYSHEMIDKNGELGCCDHYDTRVDVTDQVRNSTSQCPLSLGDVGQKWGQNFVIVASQRQRNLALLQSSACPSSVSIETYSILESVGRARYDGELTSCKARRGLSGPHLKQNAGSIFVKVKQLKQLGYVTKQVVTPEKSCSF